MDNCMHGIDARNPCQTCQAVEYLHHAETKECLAEANKLLLALGLLQSRDNQLHALGALAVAYKRGFQRGHVSGMKDAK